jgi:hypothetical protein
MNTKNDARSRDQRSHISRLTVNLPGEMMTSLKIHAVTRRTTIREVVANLVKQEIDGVRS